MGQLTDEQTKHTKTQMRERKLLLLLILILICTCGMLPLVLVLVPIVIMGTNDEEANRKLVGRTRKNRPTS